LLSVRLVWMSPVMSTHAAQAVAEAFVLARCASRRGLT